jgi:hypothetical protein
VRRDFARTLAVAAIGCFIASLLLPALDLMLFGKPLTIRGWQATAAGFDLLTKASEPRGFALGASAVANLVFLAAPWLAWGAPGRRAAMAFAVATLAGLLLALAAPHLLDRAPVLRPGYPIWIAAYALLLAGWMRRARRAASISSDESVS